MTSELHCAADESDDAIDSAAHALGMDATPNRLGRTLLLAELDADEAEAIRGAAAAAGLRTTVSAAAPSAAMRKAEPLLLLTLVTFMALVMLGARYGRYGFGYIFQLNAGELLAWAMFGVLIALFYRRFAAADVVPLWQRRHAAPPPSALSGRDLQLGIAASGLHAALCLAIFFTSTALYLSSPRALAVLVAFDVLGAFTCWILGRLLGPGGAGHYLSMLLAAYCVDLGLTVLAVGSGLATFPWYTVPVPYLASLVLGYPMLRALVFALLFLALGYALRRQAQPTPFTRLLAGAAIATGMAYATLWGWLAFAPLALFNLAVAVFLQSLPRDAALPQGSRPNYATPAA